MDGRKEGKMEGRKDGRKDERKDGWMEGRKEGRKTNSIDHILLRNCVLHVIYRKIEGREYEDKDVSSYLKKK